MPTLFTNTRYSAYALGIALAIWGAVLALHNRGADFHVYVTAGERFAEAQSLYRSSDGAMPFKYAPSAAWMFTPFSWLPLRLATALWNILGAAAFASTVIAVTRWFDESRAWVIIGAAAVLAAPFYYELFYAQADLITLALLVIALGQNDLAAGFAFAVAVQFKPPALVLGLLWIAHKHWRRVGWAALGTVVLWMPVVIRYGVSGTFAAIADWQRLLAVTSPPWVMGHNPQGLPTLLLSVLYPLDAIPANAALLLAQLLSVALLIAFVVWRRPPEPVLRAVACFAVAFLSPLAWRANFVLAWPLAVAALQGGAWIAAAGVFLTGAFINEGVLGGVERYREVAQFRMFGLALLALCLTTAWRRR